MKVVFSGLELPVVIDVGSVSVLEVHNRTLFARICQSMASSAGEEACESFYIWDDEGKALSPKNAYLFVGNPFALPWQERDLTGVLQQRFEALLFEDYELREEIESLNRDMVSRMNMLGFQMSASYSFGSEWDVRRYLKAFDFGVIRDGGSLLDNLIEFISFAADMRFERALVFVNLKTFLTERDLEVLYNQAIFYRTRLLLLENASDDRFYSQERKRVVDQHFIES